MKGEQHMNNFIFEIMSDYQKQKLLGMADNLLAEKIRHSSDEIQKIIPFFDFEQYKVYGSSGLGNWAAVPWIGIFDKEITESATHGFYIVYLFREDMSGVYLSLNQGWTYYKEKYGTKEGRINISRVASVFQKLLSSSLNDFLVDTIDLKSKSDLAKGYERAHICGKYYPLSGIPADAELARDLINMLGVYRELKGIMGSGGFESIANRLLADYELGITDDEIRNYESEFDGAIANPSGSVLTEVNIPESFSLSNPPPKNFNPKFTNFQEKADKQAKLGLAGEKMVIEYEKGKLINAGRVDLAERIRHTSKEDGDGAGYDIQSFECSGKKIYIEVKTTKGNKDRPFHLSDTELEFSRQYPDNYRLYRVFEFDPNKKTGSFFVTSGDLSKILEIYPESYIVRGVKHF